MSDLFVGVDPDTVAPAYALVREGVVVQAGLIRGDREFEDLPLELRLARLAVFAPQKLAKIIGDQSGLTFRLFVESQFLSGASCAPAIMALGRVAGIMAATCSHFASFARCEFVKPVTWKGSVKKEVHQARLLKDPAIAAHIIRVDALDQWRYTKDQRADVIDACGIALWAYRRSRS